MYTEESTDRYVTITHNQEQLQIPHLKYWGSSEVFYNGNKIPSARLWELAGAFLAHSKQVPRHLLFEEARRANIYRLIDSGQIIWTTAPRDGDKHLSGNIYARKEKQRVRFLVKLFDIRLGKVEGKPNRENITELCEFCETIGLYPIAAQENKIYFCEHPEDVKRMFNTDDILRLAVFLKRPSASCIEVNF